MLTGYNENMIITVRTQLLNEGDNIVIHITRKIINKLNGKTSTETIYREVVEINNKIIYCQTFYSDFYSQFYNAVFISAVYQLDRK